MFSHKPLFSIEMYVVGRQVVTPDAVSGGLLVCVV